MSAISYGPFLGHGVCAWTSDRSIDFLKGDPSCPQAFALTALQRDWLSGHQIGRPESVIFPKQVHGDVIWNVTAADALRRAWVEADAVITDVGQLPIAVRTADCLPVLVFDPRHRAIAAVHAGWKSSYLKIVSKTIERMRALYGTDPQDLRVSLGPCIRRESYEVGAEFEAHFPGDIVLISGQRHFDIIAANRRQLSQAGVPDKNIWDCGQDTFSNPQYHSYRRDRDVSGRMLSVIMMP